MSVACLLAFLTSFMAALPAFAQEKSDTPAPKGLTDLDRAAILAKEAHRLALEGETGEAIDRYRKALELTPEWTQIRFDLARLTLALGEIHFLNHMEHMKSSRELTKSGKPMEASNKEKKAMKELADADPLLDEALEHFQKVIKGKFSSNLLNSHVSMGRIFVLREKWKEAKKSFQKALEMKPAGQHQQKLKEAIQQMEKAIEKESAEKDKTETQRSPGKS